jgi:hypothetical protein
MTLERRFQRPGSWEHPVPTLITKKAAGRARKWMKEESALRGAGVRRLMEELKQGSPGDMACEISFDTTLAVREGIREIHHPVASIARMEAPATTRRHDSRPRAW